MGMTMNEVNDTNRAAFEAWFDPDNESENFWHCWQAACKWQAASAQPERVALSDAAKEVIERAADTLDDLGAPHNAKELRAILAAQADHIPDIGNMAAQSTDAENVSKNAEEIDRFPPLGSQWLHTNGSTQIMSAHVAEIRELRAKILELESSKCANPSANSMIQSALDGGENATGLCTVRGAVSEMITVKSDRMEMRFSHDGHVINIELLITSRQPLKFK